ncbi:MAG: glycine--tRNA ligase subunit beta [Neisseriales bacterium]|nr:MAG: glycine--tRNA ligase subunit beta [Neisseriales bacterium]
MNATLLIELQVEELPPRSLEKLGDMFAANLLDALIKQQFTEPTSKAVAYASPRRLAVTIFHVNSRQPDQQIFKKGPALHHALLANQPTRALMSFAKACQVSIDQLKIHHDGKQEVYAYLRLMPGKTLEAVLPDMLHIIFKSMSSDTFMRWSDKDDQFIRPVHGLIVLHGQHIIPCTMFGLFSTATTSGHRFLSDQIITINEAHHYASIMKEEGKVIASFSERRAYIDEALEAAAKNLQAIIADKDMLIDEVTALVEWPKVLVASFDPSFLRLPKECLMLTMQQHQKYFPLLNYQGQLIHQFLLVANNATHDSTPIIQGNERVIHARLSDAAFFFDQDQRHRLDSFTPRLANIVYHHQLGSQLDRTKRLQAIAERFAKLWQINPEHASRAAYLAKADLLTDMVGEFPALQGIMGRYYAIHDGELITIANAIQMHYSPKFAEDMLPDEPLGELLALADKLEMLVGMMGLGILPTGDKDPFALRRAALGVLRIFLKLSIDFKVLCQITFEAFPQSLLAEDTVDVVYHFCLERLKYYLLRDHAQDTIEAVLAHQPSRLDEVINKIKVIENFRCLPDVAPLLFANKRVKNILRKAPLSLKAVEPRYFVESIEHTLFEQIQHIDPIISKALANKDYQAVLSAVVLFKESIDQFFDQVMVMTEQTVLKNNRLALLAKLSTLLNAVADLSLLSDENHL